MQLVIVSKSHKQLTNFFEKQGSFDIQFSLDSVTSNLDLLMANIVKAEKFIVTVTESMDFQSEIRSLVSFFNNSSGLVRVDELVFFYRRDMNSPTIQQFINALAEEITKKSEREPGWYAPNVRSIEVASLGFDTIYKELLGKSASKVIDPGRTRVYREERGSDSKQAFEPSDETISISPFDDRNVRNYDNLKNLLRKTENPASLTALEELVPEYEDLKLVEYRELGNTDSKWVLMSGDRRSGSTTHATALAVSAAKAGKSVFIVDFSETGDICEHLKVAAATYYELSANDVLNSAAVMVDEPIAVYANSDKEVMRTLLPYMQARPNVFGRNLVLVLFGLEDLDLILGSVNSRMCKLVLSSLMFPSAISRLQSINTDGVRTLVWLNDNIISPLRKSKLTPDLIRVRSKEAGKDYKYVDPITFEDFELGADFYADISSALE